MPSQPATVAPGPVRFRPRTAPSVVAQTTTAVRAFAGFDEIGRGVVRLAVGRHRPAERERAGEQRDERLRRARDDAQPRSEPADGVPGDEADAPAPRSHELGEHERAGSATDHLSRLGETGEGR